MSSLNEQKVLEGKEGDFFFNEKLKLQQELFNLMASKAFLSLPGSIAHIIVYGDEKRVAKVIIED